jgi:iron complex outermembrane receptor protein
VNGIPTFVGVTTNAGAAEFKGIEFEGTALLARDFAGDRSRLNLSTSIGYLDAKYDEFITNVAAFDAQGRPAPTSRAQPIDVANFRRIQNTPKWTNSASLDLTVPASDGTVFANAAASYRSKNLFDKRYITSGYQFLNVNPVTGQPVLSTAATSPNLGVPGVAPSLGREGVVTAFYGSPRQVFLSFEVRF